MATSNIHPTAIIDESAVIGENNTIGAYCVIGPGVKLGDNNTLHSHVVIEANTEIGNGNTFFQFGSIGAKTQDLKYKGEPTYAKIGNNNCFREYVTIHRGTSPGDYTIIGDECNLLAYCHVAHDCILGNKIIMSNGVNLAGHVEVDDAAIIGGMSGTHQFCKIGSMVMIGATSKVVQDVMPFVIYDGGKPRVINKIGLERNGRTKEEIREVNRAFKIFFRSDLSLDDAVAKVKSDLNLTKDVQAMLDFVEKSDRGLAR